MKFVILMLLCWHLSANLFAQPGRSAPLKLGFGVSAPELFHAAVAYRIANLSQLGASIGVGPSFGSAWPALSLEHRLYLGRNHMRSGYKTWFFRQGTTFFTEARSPQRFTLNLTGGKDIPFKNAANGLTLDAGVFYLADSDASSVILIRSWNLWPALRIQFYIGL